MKKHFKYPMNSICLGVAAFDIAIAILYNRMPNRGALKISEL